MEFEQIMLDHGSGGKMSHQLTTDVLLPVFGNPMLSQLNDGAVFAHDGGRLAFSTDSYTVYPLFFPGGNIGELAINGTVNDLAMCGAEPRYISVGLIIEEGLAASAFKDIVTAMGSAARTANVDIITGDTKVVPSGAADKIFINTSGIGFVPEGVDISAAHARPGDRILLSGTIADHGMTILTQREGLTFDAPISSDTVALNRMVAAMLDTERHIHVLRDPTRGGVGTALNEIARSAGVGIRIRETAIPVRPEVAGVCELLGFDPLYVANEGKLLAVVPAESADAVLDTMHRFPEGKDACMIGDVCDDHCGKVFMQTVIGGKRIVDMLTGEQLPRIC